jgi:hypothetical protein
VANSLLLFFPPLPQTFPPRVLRCIFTPNWLFGLIFIFVLQSASVLNFFPRPLANKSRFWSQQCQKKSWFLAPLFRTLLGKIFICILNYFHFCSYVERYPRPGESVRGKEFKLWCGGKGANQAVMASKLGANVKMVGMVGEDIFGDANIKSMQDNGVNTDLIAKTSKSSTATGCVTVTEDGENCIVVTLGANLEITVSCISLAYYILFLIP